MIVLAIVTIIAVIATLLYVISPIDMTPDAIPVDGYKDDAMVVAFCVKLFSQDLDKYRVWLHENSQEACQRD